MFGSKKKIDPQEFEKAKEEAKRADDFYGTLIKKGEGLGADFEEIDSSSERLEAGINQVNENGNSIIELIQENVSTEASLIFTLEDMAGRLAARDEKDRAICENTGALMKTIEDLVDGNKHFTTPSKDLKEISPKLIEYTKEIRSDLSKMEDFSKQMGVLSLNAAIEAGRLGDSGREFVGAAEEIRTFTANYNEAISQVREKLDEQDKWIADVDEKLNHLISLLKENNISTTKLLKPSTELVKLTDEAKENFADEVMAARENIISTKDNSEEILRAGERNNMQYSDMVEDYRVLMNNTEEIKKEVSAIVDAARDNKTDDKGEE